MVTTSLEELVARAEANPKALAKIAIALLAQGNEARARELACRAVKLAPEDPEIRSVVAHVLSQGIPRWHFDLPFDGIRNAAYEAALARAVKPGLKILEIGSGTGLLAMMAARAGATEVVTCEAVPAIATMASEIVAKNGYADRVRVVAKHSDDLDAERDLGGRADVLVSEILANDVVGENVLPTIEKAKRWLLKKDARIIPARVTVCIALAQDAEAPFERMSMVEGFDLSAFNRLAPPRYRVSVHSSRLILRSGPADLFAFNFQEEAAFPEGHAEVTVSALGGEANCIVQWIRCDMDEVGSFENSPRSGKSAWALDVYPLLRPANTTMGQKVTIYGAHDRNTLRCWAHHGPQENSI